MNELELTEKFIGFVDILGYSALTKSAEQGNGLSLADLDEIIRQLGTEEDRVHHEKYGPTMCPESPRVKKNMDFQIAQAWDSVLVSTEISPAGIINLVSHCWGACIKLLTKGIMCRGYIKRGMIYHKGIKVLGSGHTDIVAKEKEVSIFKRDADERGTPFIEIDSDVVEYISNQPDKCVKEMFSRMVVSNGGLTAIFPVKALSHSFIIGPRFDGQPFNPKKEKASNDIVRQNLKNLKQKILSFVDPSDLKAVNKSHHYIAALDKQLTTCDQTDEFIDSLMKPFPSEIYTRQRFPGLP